MLGMCGNHERIASDFIRVEQVRNKSSSEAGKHTHKGAIHRDMRDSISLE